MNNNSFMKLSLLFFILLFTINLISAFPLTNNSNTLIVSDNASTAQLPDKFRNITTLNISGSAEFTPNQLPNIKKVINKPTIYVIDLRQESHGFVNDIAISFYNPDKDLNNGFTTEESENAENKLLSSIKLNKPLNIYTKLGKLFETIDVISVNNEEKLVTENNLNYLRLSVKDGGIPSPLIIDDFVQFIKNKNPDAHLHFHCDAGEGRTTTFMVLYQIMNNSNNLSLEQILTYQANMGGIILTTDSDRAFFLQKFYDYVAENKNTNYEINFSDWVKK